MKKLVLAIALVFGLAATAFAGPAEDQFTKMDKNKDGKVSKKEFIVYYPVAQWNVNFKGKKSITVTEYVAVHETLQQFKRNNK